MSKYQQKYKRKDEKFSKIEKEYEFARWFWNQGEGTSWDTAKIFVTIVGCLAVCISAYIVITSLNTSLFSTILVSCILFGILVMSNGKIWSTFIHRNHKMDGTTPINSYNDLEYYFIEGHEEVMFIENGRDLTAVGFFKLKALPLVIKGTLERFVRALYEQQIPVFWTWAQAPVDEGSILGSPAVSEEAREHYLEQPAHEFRSRMESHGGVWVARLLLGTRRSLSAGANIESKRIMLYKQLTADLFKISTAFTGAYPHTILEPLHGKELIKAHSITITGGGIPAFF